MNKILNFQMSIFGSYIHLQPQPELEIALLEALAGEEFVSGFFDVPIFNPNTGGQSLDRRLQLVSSDKAWAILLLPDRINFVYSYLDGAEEYKNMVELEKYGENLIFRVFDVLGEMHGNRLALICTMELNQMDQKGLSQFSERFIRYPGVYRDACADEWGVRYNVRGKLSVSENISEDCNRIIEINQTENWDGTVLNHPLLLSFDVNTLAFNCLARFQCSDFTYFAQDAMRFVMDVIRDVEGQDETCMC